MQPSTARWNWCAQFSASASTIGNGWTGPGEGVRAFLRMCVMVGEGPAGARKVGCWRDPPRRIRFLTHEDAQRLLQALPEHLADMAALSLATGLRASNVTGLQWSQVDLARRLAWIHPDQAKARKAIAVPLNAEALALITKQVGKHLTHVFSYRGKPIIQSTRRPGMRRSSAQGSLIFGGTICGTPGRAGTCRTARRCSRCRSWAAGRRPRWCGVTRISPPITWRLTRNV